jgi:DnaJ-class molecular chaperone
MAESKVVCVACDGTGLQADDEEWKYPCTVCGGDGVRNLDESPEPDEPFSVDENNRTLE